jgi:hypothetical protein
VNSFPVSISPGGRCGFAVLSEGPKIGASAITFPLASRSCPYVPPGGGP